LNRAGEFLEKEKLLTGFFNNFNNLERFGLTLFLGAVNVVREQIESKLSSEGFEGNEIIFAEGARR
jgi:hypothetical protein